MRSADASLLPTLVTLVWTSHAARAYDALREPYRTQVDRLLVRFVLYGEGDVRPIEGHPGRYRLKSRSRRETHRVSFIFLENAILLADIERRDKAYKAKR